MASMYGTAVETGLVVAPGMGPGTVGTRVARATTNQEPGTSKKINPCNHIYSGCGCFKGAKCIFAHVVPFIILDVRVEAVRRLPGQRWAPKSLNSVLTGIVALSLRHRWCLSHSLIRGHVENVIDLFDATLAPMSCRNSWVAS